MEQGLNQELELARGLFARGEAQRAADSLRTLSTRFPDQPEVWLLQGQIALEMGLSQDAVISLRRALDLDPKSLNVASPLALALGNTGQGQEAYELLRQFFLSGQSGFDAHLNMAHICLGIGRCEEGAEHAGKALLLNPESTAAAVNQFLCQRADSPLEAWRTLRDVALRQSGVGSLKVAAAESLYLSELDESEVKRLHDEVGRRLCDNIAPTRRYMGKPVVDRPLKVGFLSADFRRHPVASFTLSFIGELEKQSFTLSFYSLNVIEDEVTQFFKELGSWRQCAGMRAVALASQIHTDAVDILIDLSGLTVGGRPEVLAMKPAPVVISAIGYPNEVGIERVDGNLCDSITDPDPSANTVKPLWVDPPFLCYRPYEALPPLSGAARTGPLVWGALCNVRKLSAATLDLWCSVLNAVPGSTLVCTSQEFASEQEANRVRTQFSRLGLGERVTLSVGPRNYAEYMLGYQSVDVILDTFPFNGATTTMDAYLMGVPVLTLYGASHRSRVGKCLAESLGKPNWVAETPEEFVRIAVQMSEALDSVRAEKGRIRELAQQSALMDSSAYAKKFATALRSAWKRYCDSVAI